jgi:protease I
MADKNLQGKKVAILATDGFEQVELLKSRAALDGAGAVTNVIAPDKTQKSGEIKGWDMTDWGAAVKVDKPLSQAKASDYDALVLPGGVINPDKLRTDKQAVSFVKEFFANDKPVGAICHGPWTLIEADVVKGRTMTSWPSLQTDLRNAGAKWVDQEVVVDNGLVTSRKPDDIPAFNNKLIEEFAEGKHSQQMKRAS